MAAVTMRNKEDKRNNGCQEKNGKEILESRNERELKGKEEEARSPRFEMLI